MEAYAFRDGALRADAVPLDALRDAVSELEEGEWIWVDAVDPTTDDLTTLQKQLDLHDLAVEDVQQRNQRPKLDLYQGHAFAVFRPLSCGPDGLTGSELFLFVSRRYLVTLRFPPIFEMEKAKHRWPILAALAPGP
jgi:magnesium transporter